MKCSLPSLDEIRQGEEQSQGYERPAGKVAASSWGQARLDYVRDGPEHVILRSGELGVA